MFMHRMQAVLISLLSFLISTIGEIFTMCVEWRRDIPPSMLSWAASRVRRLRNGCTLSDNEAAPRNANYKPNENMRGIFNRTLASSYGHAAATILRLW